MPSTETLEEAKRLMTICNACRYCEGFCAVFPAMELRREFKAGDLKYLANLCHECRGCWYACQYASPHEFDVNVPRTFSRLRVETYRDYAWPGFLSRLFKKNGVWVGGITLVSVLLVFGLTLTYSGPENLFDVHVGEGAFYAVIPYLAMVVPAAGMFLFSVFVLLGGTIRFWRETGGELRQLVQPSVLWIATKDAFGLRYMKGGGDGCNYPGRRFSHSRRLFHHLVFYGFLLDLAATTVAAIYDHGFGWAAPYAYFSLPVVLGTSGGVGLLVGCAGLLWLKAKSDSEPAEKTVRGMDVVFLYLLAATSATGLGLLVLRETAVMGTLLAIHLGFVAGVFLTLPYGKFAHVGYRYAALVRNAIEQSRGRA